MMGMLTRVVCAAGLALLAPPAAAQATSRTTYVIVHGAWGGGWDWRQVDSLLTAHGNRVVRVTLTGLGERVHLASPEIGLRTHIQDVVNTLLFEQLSDVVLVGHSYGGMVITGVADSVPERIRRLVYIDALLPNSGESFLSLMEKDFGAVVRDNTHDGLIGAPWEPASKPFPKDVPQPVRTFTDTLWLRHGPTGPPLRADYILTVQGSTPDPFQPFADRAAARGWPVHRLEADHVPERSALLPLVELLLRLR
jgi:pimeloyl-ACP methyl ester carboxylesterase